MKIKRFFAKDMKTALKEVKETLGADAVIMSNKKVAGGIELVAAVDDNAPPSSNRGNPPEQPSQGNPGFSQASQDDSAQEQNTPPDSLAALLKRQQKSNAAQGIHDPDDSLPPEQMADRIAAIAQNLQATGPGGRAVSQQIRQHLDKHTQNSAHQSVSDDRFEQSQQPQSFQQQTSQNPDYQSPRQHNYDHMGSPQNDALQNYGNAPQNAHYSYDISSQQQSTRQQGFQNQQPDLNNARDLNSEVNDFGQQLRPENHLHSAASDEMLFNQAAQESQSGDSSGEYKQQMESLKQEMESIKKILTHQVSGLMWQELSRKEPVRAMLISRLRKMGLSEQVADQLACFIPEDLPHKEAWDSVIELLKGQLTTTNNDVLGRGGYVALVGPTGVGKTTTIAKLAARFAQLHGAENLALVTTDTYRIGAHEQLSTFGKIIGCPVRVTKSATELREVLAAFRNKRLVLIDTAGMSQRDLRLTEQLSSLMKNSQVKIKSYLVLSSTAQRNVTEDIVQHFKRIPLAGCIFTKIDECVSLGEIISVAIQNALPIGYVTTGQRVPEDIEVVDPKVLVDQAKMFLEKNSGSEHTWFSDPESHAVGMYD